jgi:pyruvyltransferase
MHSRSMSVAWCRVPKPGNFGDILTPFILRHYGYQVSWAGPESADYYFVGSIAKWARENTTVLGSGSMTAAARLNPRARWRWVRGPRTRELVIKNGGSCPEIYGDPALLLPRCVECAEEKIYPVGIVPHYVDYQEVKESFPDLPVINLINADVREVVRQITQCECIISSSLHGIIAAHAYGIPAAWVKFSDRLAGDDTKFHDHHEALGLEAKLSTIKDPVFQLAGFDDQQIHDILARGDF